MYIRETHEQAHQERLANNKAYSDDLDFAITHPIQHMNQEQPNPPATQKHGRGRSHHRHYGWNPYRSPAIGGGGGLQSGIGKIPLLGNVPASSTQSSGSPVLIIVVIAGVAAIGFVIWNKLHKASHSEKQMTKEEHNE